MRPLGAVPALAAWELRRLARRGLAVRVRLVLLYTLLLAFLGFAAVEFSHLPTRDVFLARVPPISPQASSAFAHNFALLVLEVQLAAVVAATPALAAAAVAEEKDRQTLPVLLTTPLTDREIVFGKAAGRALFVLVTLLAGLPVLLVALPFGGADVGFVAAGYALTAGTAVLCAALGVAAACRAPGLRGAAVGAYGRVAVLVCGGFVPPFVLASPFGLVAALAEPGYLDGLASVAVAVGYPVLQLLVAAVVLARAARGLRLRGATAGPPPVTSYPPPPRPAEPPVLGPDDEVPPDLPPLGAADPVLWKERCVGWRPAWAVPAAGRALGAAAGGLAVGLFVWGTWAQVSELVRRLDSDVGRPGGAAGLLLAAGVFAAGRYLVPVAAGVSGAIAGERARGTLDALLSTTLDRRAVLRAKVRAHAERGTGFAAVAVAAVGMAFIAAAGTRVGVAAAALVAAGAAVVLAAGAWLTVRCPGDVRAFRLLLPVAVLATGWPVALWNLPTGVAALPPEGLFNGLLGACGVCGATAGVLWWLAGRALARGE